MPEPTDAPSSDKSTSASGDEQSAATPAAKPKDEPSVLADIWDWIKSIIIGFAIFAFIRIFIIQTFTIISGSMEDTLLIGDFLVLSKSAYGATLPFTHAHLPGYSSPTRNDVVVFKSHHETPQIDLVKRLVGLPGDTISMRGGVLYLDGKPRDEPYVKHSDDGAYDGNDPRMSWQTSFLVDSVRAEPYFPTRDNWGPIVVPPASYFMMGDNREQSLDSRYWGFVPKRDLLGRAVALYLSYDKDVGGSFFHHIRWARVGTRIR